MTPQELLLRAAYLLEHAVGHNAAALAHTFGGKPCDPHSPEAAYLSACGAIQRARQPDGWVDALDKEGLPLPRSWMAQTKREAAAAIESLTGERATDRGPFFEWEKTASRDEVLAKMREAAGIAGKVAAVVDAAAADPAVAARLAALVEGAKP